MKHLKKTSMMYYCEKVIVIEGLETALIYCDKMDEFLKDRKLLEELSIPIHCEDIIRGMIEASRLFNLRLGVIKRPYAKGEIFFPVLCAYIESEFYHVHYKNPWICRECGFDNGGVIMPLVECGDGIIYPGRRNVRIPHLLKKQPCKKCGKTLQNHILFMY